MAGGCNSRRWQGAFALMAALLASSAAQGATIVTDHVASLAHANQTDVPVTFGQVFKAGAVPRGKTVAALLDGQPVPLQVDAKATNADGSLRHAVLTLRVPALAKGDDLQVALTAVAVTTPVAPVSLADVLATHYDASVILNLDGIAYQADARGLLLAAASHHSCRAWGTACNLWLSGPLAGEWIVNGPVADKDGIANPNLRVYFDVRAYAGVTPGSIASVRTDIIIENTSAYAPQAQPRYTATLASGSATYTSPELTQYPYTRWHKAVWWNNARPQVYLRQDTRHIQDTMAVSRYQSLRPDPKFLQSLRQTCAPLDHCDQTLYMPQTGAQAAIGPLPRWASLYLVDPDLRAYRWMLANTDALGAYSAHYRDAATGWPLSIHRHPNVTILNWADANRAARGSGEKAEAYRRDLLPTCSNNAVVKTCGRPWYVVGNPATWDNAHQPAAGYVAYMVTGSYFDMGELAFYASMTELSANEGYRGFSKGLIDDARGQVRSKAWCLRQLVNAAWLLPDGYPLKAEFNADVNNAIADFNARYTDNPHANHLGLMRSGTTPYSLHGGTSNAVAPWQHSFLTWSAGHAAELGFVGAARFRDWLARFDVGLMTDWLHDPTHGYCWLQASAYDVQVKDAAGHWLPNYTAVYAATFPSMQGLACNSPAMVKAMGIEVGKRWQLGEMRGYPDSATGFPANAQVGLATAADSGVPGARDAWTLFESRSVKPTPPNGYDDYPNFAIVPRDGGGRMVHPPAARMWP